MTREEALKFWEFRYENAKDFSDPHWEAQERREHREYVEVLRMAIESLQKDIERHKMVIRASERHLGVVRCKDCKHRSNGGWCDVYIQPRMDMDFCNHGERQCNYFGERRELNKGGDNE